MKEKPDSRKVRERGFLKSLFKAVASVVAGVVAAVVVTATLPVLGPAAFVPTYVSTAAGVWNELNPGSGGTSSGYIQGGRIVPPDLSVAQPTPWTKETAVNVTEGMKIVTMLKETGSNAANITKPVKKKTQETTEGSEFAPPAPDLNERFASEGAPPAPDLNERFANAQDTITQRVEHNKNVPAINEARKKAAAEQDQKNYNAKTNTWISFRDAIVNAMRNAGMAIPKGFDQQGYDAEKIAYIAENLKGKTLEEAAIWLNAHGYPWSKPKPKPDREPRERPERESGPKWEYPDNGGDWNGDGVTDDSSSDAGAGDRWW